MSNKVYAFFDGDGIGNKLEVLLLENKIDDAQKYSSALKKVFSEIEDELISDGNIEIIIIGGDDLLIELDFDNYGIDYLEKIRSKFEKRTGSTFSCGIGKNIQEAISNLYFAKVYGKNQIKNPF
jgi:hypothetical protein